MPRYKEGKNTYYTKEEKIRICKKVINDGKSSYEVAKEENIASSGMIRRWVKEYIEYPDLLENKKKPGEESIKYPNLINGNWNTTRPLEKVVTDTTMIWFKRQKYDWTYYIDVFNNKIIGSNVRPFLYCSSPINHKLALESMLKSKIKRGYESQNTIMHSDQGSIYSSIALTQVHKDYTITRSMSRIATPTDNPIIESKNGWLKKEMYMDFNQDDYETVEDYINAIIDDHNNYRPSYALNYKTPIEYRTLI